jgi:hypothetical protein
MCPPSLIEWKSATESSFMAMSFKLVDETEILGQLNPWSTANSLSGHLLQENGYLNAKELNGWTICVRNTATGTTHEAIGDAYVLDLISAVENSPVLPLSKAPFLCSSAQKERQNKNDDDSRHQRHIHHNGSIKNRPRSSKKLSKRRSDKSSVRKSKSAQKNNHSWYTPRCLSHDRK